MFQNLVGRKFGRLMVKELSDDATVFEGMSWSCICDCGVEKVISGNALIGKTVTHCGCSGSKDKFSKIINGDEELSKKSDGIDFQLINDVYNNPKTFEQKIWADMISKCYDKNNKSYHFFGGKNIAVCNRWLFSFENFLEDMGKSPNDKNIIIRRNGSKLFSKEDCRWSPNYKTPKFNKVDSYYEYNGQRYTISQLADLPEIKAKGIMRVDLYSRIVNCGWTVEKAVSTKMNSSERKTTLNYTYNGVTKSIVKWALQYKISYDLLHNRLMNLKWDFEKAVNTPSKRPAKYTHNGVTKTILQLSREHNVNYIKLYNRLINHGWSLERAIATP